MIVSLPDVSVKGDHAQIKVYIAGMLHFSIIRDDLLSIQSWKVDDSLFQIEYVTKIGIKIRTDYDNKDIWLKILEGLDNIAIAVES